MGIINFETEAAALGISISTLQTLAPAGDNPTAPVAAVTDITTIDAVDPATTQAMANECKAKINELLGALRDAGLMAGGA